MRPGGTRSFPSVAVAVFVVATSVVVGGIAMAAGPACGPSWSIVPSSAAVKDPKGIAVVSANDVWVAGGQTAGTAKVHPATEHWNGSKWKLVSTPFEGLGENNLNGISAVASDDVWAVGYWQPEKKLDAAFHTLTEHWNGTKWSIVPSPTVGGNSNTLTAVSAVSAGDVWAVGYYFDSATKKRSTLVEHWNGTAWSVVPSPDPGTASNSLLAVAAVSAGDVWAAGFTGDGLGYTSLLEHWNGTAWSVVPSPHITGATEDVLAGLSEDGASSVWAFGYDIVGGTYRSLVERWDGAAWSVVPGTANGSDGIATILRGGSAVGGQAWGAGFEYRLADGRYKEFTEYFNGTAWTAVPGALAPEKDKSEMYAIAQVPGKGQVWAAARSNHIELICPAGPAFFAAHPITAGSAAPRSRPGYLTRPASPGAIPDVVRPVRGAQSQQAEAVTDQDVAIGAGIFELTITHGAVVADFNGDGWQDIFLGRHLHTPKLYLNNRDGTFRLVDDDGEFRVGDTHGCAAADFNRDGLMDIFCNTGSDRGTEAKRDNLYIQQPDGTFIDKAGPEHVLQSFDRGRWSATIDANGDGYPDVFTSNFPDRADGMPSANRLALSQGGSSFLPAPSYGVDEERNGASLAVGDYDNDGFQDLMVAGSAGLVLYHNDHGAGFTNVTDAVGLASKPSYAEFVDFNRDGRLDVAEVTKGSLKIYVQSGGHFTVGPKIDTLVSGYSLATGNDVDVNGDGWPDVYVMQSNASGTANAPDYVFLNDGSGGFAASPVAIPQPGVLGKADQATPIDFDHNGLTDFLVQNGNSTAAGAIQLIEFSPA